MKGIDNDSVDLILCDLPYGVSGCSWDSIIPLDELWCAYNRIIKDDGVIALFSAEPFTTSLIASNYEQFKYCWYWIKPNATTPHLAKKQPMRKCEQICIFGGNRYYPQMTEGRPYKWNSKRSKGEASNITYKKDTPINNTGFRYPTNVLEFPQERGLHPTQKPVPLLEYLIKTYTNEGDVVLDNCMGSGSTVVASINTNRNFIGIEKDGEIFEAARKRVYREGLC